MGRADTGHGRSEGGRDAGDEIEKVGGKSWRGERESENCVGGRGGFIGSGGERGGSDGRRLRRRRRKTVSLLFLSSGEAR